MVRKAKTLHAREPLVVTVTRKFAASPDRVFDAWLDPKALGRWLFATPTGVMKTVQVDPRVGGGFLVAEQRGDILAEHFGTYLEIERPRRIVFSFATDRNEPPSKVSVTVFAEGSGCVLTLVHEMDPKWAEYAERTRSGWTMILEALSKIAAEE